VNKVPKTDYKGQTARLLPIFVLVGMVFIVPAITEKALAGVNAVATCTVKGGFRGQCDMTVVGSSLSSGKWVERPTVSGDTVRWKTTGNPPGGNEKGVVNVEAGGGLKTLLTFDNPWFGRNSCKILPTTISMHSTFGGSCEAGYGNNADFTYTLRLIHYR